ncbi:MAG: aldehyde ferredoxin oxidoreductase family protein [Promethearchaeota archaeon]
MFGYAGRRLNINLTDGSIRTETLTEEFCQKYIGGYGFGAKVLWDELKPGIDALSPENILVYATGPAQASLLPTASKYGIFAKSPLTGLFGMAISSGSVGQQSRRTGHDLIAIYGKAEKPVYIFIDDDIIDLIDASHLWGQKDTWETEDIIREEQGDSRIGVASIGIAGEKLSKLACITNDRNRQAGRTGMGAVMGSKNIKAIAFRGSKDVAVRDKDTIMVKYADLLKRAVGPATIKYRDLGTPINMMVFQNLGVLPTRNFTDGQFEQAEALSGETMADKWVVKKAACSKCPIACDHLCLVNDKGPYQDSISSVDFESIFALGSCTGVGYFPAVTRAIEICDRLGIDTMSGGVTVAHAMECFEKGLITKEDTGGLDLRFGNHEAMVKFVENMCTRETKAGDLWSDGSRAAAQKIGKGSMDFAMQIKGLEIPGYALRGLKTAALGFSVSIRGACHLRNGAYSPDIKGSVDRLKEEAGRGKKLVIPVEDMYAIIDSLIICKFTRGVYTGDDEIAECYQMITGIPMDVNMIRKAGERILNLSKCFNIREGAGRKDDYPPARCFNETLKSGPSKGVKIDKKGFDAMLDEYYESRGWTKEGIPTPEKLKELGLDFVKLDVK